MKTRFFLTLFAAWLLAGSVAAQSTNAVERLWKFRFSGGEGESSPALAPDGTVYVGDFRGWFYALSPEGKLKWKFKSGLEIKSSPAVGPDGTVYFGSRDRNLYALSPEGKLRWKFTTAAWVDSSPGIAEDSTIYFGSWDKVFYALNPDGSLKWKFITGGLITSSPAIAADGTIYFGSHDKNLYALNPDGSLKWKFATGGEIDSSPTIAANGSIYAASTDGRLRALRLDGTESWSLHIGGYTGSSPVLDAEGNLYLAASKKHISVGSNGKLRWERGTDVNMNMSPAATTDGGVYFAIPWLHIGSIEYDRPWPPRWSLRIDSNPHASPNVDANGVIYANAGNALHALKPLTNAAPLAKSSWPVWRANLQHTGRVQKLAAPIK